MGDKVSDLAIVCVNAVQNHVIRNTMHLISTAPKPPFEFLNF